VALTMTVFRCPRCDGMAFTLSPDHRWVRCDGCGLDIDLAAAEVQPIVIRGYNDGLEQP
jgi:hypothetical protein